MDCKLIRLQLDGLLRRLIDTNSSGENYIHFVFMSAIIDRKFLDTACSGDYKHYNRPKLLKENHIRALIERINDRKRPFTSYSGDY
ncbi:hypothetical protein [Oceanobacillus luteolus]|nr:hypothetical protein [Oceanobacillus luteolus]